MVYDISRWLSRLTMTVLFRARVWGAENVPERGGVLVASNHQSFADPPLVGAPLRRRAHYMARSSLFGVPGLGWVIARINAFPVQRGGVDRQAMRTAIELMRQGQVLILFPEGTRSVDGEVQAFSGGFALLAARAGVPIVPAAVYGAFGVWPRHRPLPWPGVVHVAYGEPLEPPGPGKDACRRTADEVRARVLALHEMLKEKD